MRIRWSGLFLGLMLIGAGAAALAARPVVACSPGQTASPVQEEQSALAKKVQKLAVELEARRAEWAQALAEKQAAVAEAMQERQAELAAQKMELAARVRELAESAAGGLAQEPNVTVTTQGPIIQIFDEESGWLGVSIAEVTAEKAKELKLPAERGVLVNEVEAESPAAKAGLKANDVISEFNGQRIEGAAQFRRLVQETPAGRTVQLTVWRDGRAQTLSVQLGNRRTRIERDVRVLPRLKVAPEFDFKLELPEIGRLMTTRPRLGVATDDLSGQLGEYFGAPGGEGVLIREVTKGSPAEKAGLKAGDVIIKIDGERIRTSSELREKLAEKREKKTVSVGIIRKGAESAVSVELEPPQPPKQRPLARRVAT